MVNFNGQLFPASTPLLQAGNRAFNYGDSLFETMRISNGKILLLEKHWNRLSKSMKVLHLYWPSDFSCSDFENECLKIYPEKGNFRIRFTAWRAGEGLYTPKVNHANFLITGNPIESDPYPYNANGIQLHLFEQKAIYADSYSWIKSSNALPYVLAGIAKQEANWEDCLLLNSEGRIAEASSSNIFLIKNSQLITPPLSEGCIAGVMREHLLEKAAAAHFLVLEKSIEEAVIFEADEVFLSNSIMGIKWVTQYKKSTFANSKSQLLNSLISS